MQDINQNFADPVKKVRKKSAKETGRKGQCNRLKLRKRTRIINWNVQGKLSDPAQQEALMTELNIKEAKVACLQETRWNVQAEVKLKGLGRLINIPARAENVYRRYGMGFYISEDWEPRYMGVEYISDRIALIKFRVLEESNKPLILINVYGPTNRYTKVGDISEVEEFYEELARIIEEYKQKAAYLLVGGDFNSKIGQKREEDGEIMGKFTKGFRNVHGDYLAGLMKQTKLFLCNTAFKHRDHHIATWHGSHLTRQQDGTETRKGIHNQIDYMAILQRHKGMVTNSRSYQGVEFESDHSMVVTDIRLKAIYPISQRKAVKEKQRELSTLHRDPEIRTKYEDELKKNISKSDTNIAAAAEFLGESISADDKLYVLGASMKTAIEKSVPLAPKKVGGRVIYNQDPKLKAMSVWRKKLWKTYINSRSSDETKKATYMRRKVIFKEMKKRIKELNTERINRIAEELEANSARGGNRAMYEYARMLKKKVFIRFSIIDNEGFEQFNPANILPLLRDHYEAKFNQEGIETLEPWNGDPMPLEKPITEEEVQEAISKLNNNRSVGPDGIPTEWYKYGGAQVNKFLSIEFNKMFATNEKMRSLTEGILIPINKPNEPRIPAKTRPIVLFNTIRKIFCLVTKERALEKMEKYVSQNQHGYRPRRSTTELAWAAQWMKATVEKYKESYSVITTDMSEAFDRAYRDLLMQILERDVGLNKDELRMTRALLSGITLRIRVGGILGEEFETRKGVPQGDGLSPHLFIVYMEYISREYAKACIAKPRKFDIRLTYADDDNFYLHDARGQEGPCMEDCRCNKCQQYELLWKLPAIMQAANMKMNPGKTKFNKLERKDRRETSIAQVGSNVNSTRELKVRIANGLGALLGLTKIWLKGNPISQKTKIRLYTITVLPHLLYNIHATALTGAELEKLNTAQRRHLRKVLGIYWPNRLSVRATYRSSGTRAVSIDIIKRRWQFIGHILRNSDQAPAYKAMEIYYADRLPEDEESNRAKKRIQHQGRPFANLPQIINEEFKMLPRLTRIELTGGIAAGGISEITTIGHIRKLRAIAGDNTEAYGAKWKKLVKAIEDAAEREWIAKERKRLRAKRNKLRDRYDPPEQEEEQPEQELYPIFVKAINRANPNAGRGGRVR